jgi:hypothetical protein
MSDFFVSYAHVDDEQPPGLQETGWVTTLVKWLKYELVSRVGRSDMFDMWRDTQLSGNMNVEDEIERVLRDSAMLLVVMSPGYLASCWCEREKNWFLRKVAERSGRVFLVERIPVDRNKWPCEFKNLKGYEFYVMDREGKPARTLGDPFVTTDERAYFDAVKDLAYDMSAKLKDLACNMPAKSNLRQKKLSGMPAPAPSASSVRMKGPTVFLAEVTDDLNEKRREARRYLEQAGLDVLPKSGLPDQIDLFRKQVGEQLLESILFIQLLSAFPGKPLTDLPEGKPQCQYEMALRIGLTIFQWREMTLDINNIKEKKQRDLLQLKTVRSQIIGDFLADVVAQAQKLDEQKRVARKPVVFIDIHPHDSVPIEFMNATKTLNAIFIYSKSDNEKPLDAKSWRCMVRDSDGVLVVYGSDLNWTIERVVAWKKMRTLSNKLNTSIAIFDGSPIEKPEFPMGGDDVMVISGRSNIDRMKLKIFIENLIG